MSAPPRTVYLDHNATTPCDPRVVDANANRRGGASAWLRGAIAADVAAGRTHHPRAQAGLRLAEGLQRLAELQTALRCWRRDLHHDQPHRALARQTPAKRSAVNLDAGVPRGASTSCAHGPGSP